MNIISSSCSYQLHKVCLNCKSDITSKKSDLRRSLCPWSYWPSESKWKSFLRSTTLYLWMSSPMKIKQCVSFKALSLSFWTQKYTTQDFHSSNQARRPLTESSYYQQKILPNQAHMKIKKESTTLEVHWSKIWSQNQVMAEWGHYSKICHSQVLHELDRPVFTHQHRSFTIAQVKDRTHKANTFQQLNHHNRCFQALLIQCQYLMNKMRTLIKMQNRRGKLKCWT